MDDSTLLSALQAKDAGAYEYFFKKYYRFLVLYALQFLEEDAAKDIVQEIFIDFWERKLYKRVDGDTLRGYIVRMTRNRCLNSLRNKRSRAQKEAKFIDTVSGKGAESAPVYWHHTEHPFLAVLPQLVQQLPQRQLEVVYHMYYDELSRTQTANKLNIAATTVASHAKNALKLLRSSLKLNPSAERNTHKDLCQLIVQD
ncbi:sigma-70 family RNA polymerase sigma factor [Chitinophaga horti]|uniref:Sigma-70 family RNA polymerase sigma factor n=1 Tax=Chitinophaga horti TaxID=2920382 RepID=A0ABY6J8D1_9BACT|nr:sigma-70 family RNA polymerase sigma factor [Chitinophaga horti]UYQ94404.1 sigma-70 family RNA polymerase sigma factor [Chitinophaga horti]